MTTATKVAKAINDLYGTTKFYPADLCEKKINTNIKIYFLEKIFIWNDDTDFVWMSGFLMKE